MFRDEKKPKPFSIGPNLGNMPKNRPGGGGGGGGDRKPPNRKKEVQDTDALSQAIERLIGTFNLEIKTIGDLEKKHAVLRAKIIELMGDRKSLNAENKNTTELNKLITSSMKKQIAENERLKKSNEAYAKQLKKRERAKVLKEEKRLLKEQITFGTTYVNSLKHEDRQAKKLIATKKKQNAINRKLGKARSAQIQQEKAASEKEIAIRDQSRQKLIELNNVLKKHKSSLRAVTKDTDLLARARRGDANALATVARRTKEATTAGTKLNKSLGLQIRNTRNVHNSFSVLRSKLLLASFGYTLLIAKVINLVKAYGVQQRAEAAFASALKSTGVSAGQTSRSIKLLAADIQRLTGVGDESVIASSALLKTFTNIGTQAFPQAQKAIVDVAAGMYQGNVTMEALKTTTIQVGKALNDPIKGMAALSRVGVQFSGKQKIAIKRFIYTNQLAKAQGIILGELEKQFGGLGEAIKDTSEGKMLALNSAFSDFQERLGSGIAPIMDAMVVNLTKMFEAMDIRHVVNFVAALGLSVVGYTLYTTKIAFATIATKLFTTSILSNIAAMKLWQSSTGIGLIIAAGTALITTLLNVASGFHDSGQAAEDNGSELDKLREKWNRLHNAATQGSKTDEIRERWSNISNAISENDTAITSLKFKTADLSVEQNRLNDLKLQYLRATNISVNADVQGNEKIAQGLETKIRAQQKLANIEAEDRKVFEKQIQGFVFKNEVLEEELIKTEARIALSEELVKAKKKEEESFKAQKIVDATEKYNNQAKAQKELNDLNEDFGNLLFGASRAQTMLLKEGQKYGLSIAELKEHHEGLTDAIEEYSDSLDRAAAKSQILSELNKAKSETISFMNSLYDAEMEKLDEVMNKDIENAKQSSAYKLAQKRGDQVMMDKIEEKARKKTLQGRVKAFKSKQNVALGGIAIDAAGAIIKAYKDYGFWMGSIVSGLITASAGLQATIVTKQKAPAYARGGDFVTTGPQMIMVGDNPGGRERVSVTPLSSPNFDGPAGGSVNISFSGNVLSQDFIEDEAIPMIKEAIRRGADIGVS